MRQATIIGWIVLMCVGWASAFLCTAQIEPRQVLVLHSYHVGQPMEDGFVRGLQQSADRSGMWIEFYYEYMDAKRHPPPQLDTLLQVSLQRKYAGKCFDALITADNIALDFAIAHRDSFFKDLPLLFLGVNNFGPATLAGISNVTGIVEDNDFPGTLELMSTLEPDVRDLYLITDLTETGNRMKAMATAKLAGNPRWNVHWLQNETYVSLLDTLSRPGGLAVMLTYSIDRDQNFYSESKLIEMLGTHSKKPVFVMLEHQVRHGVVGGSVLSGDEHGLIAGGMLVRILQGVHADSIPIVQQSPKLLLVDYNALDHFQMDPGVLPPATHILHAPFSVWKAYKATILFMLLIMFILLVAIIVLVRVRKQLQESRKHYRELVEKANTVILRTDASGKIMYMNEYGESLFGYSSSEIIGKNVMGTLVPQIESTGRSLQPTIESIFSNPEKYSEFENENVTKDGRRLWMRWNNQPILNKSGQLKAILSVGIDNTEKQKRDLEIVKFNRKVAHDLRAPLVTIAGFAGMIPQDYSEAGPAAVESDIRYIQHAVTKMGKLLNDLSKMFSDGEVHNTPERFTLADVLEDARMLVAGRLMAQSIQVHLLSNGWIMADRERLVDVFLNLLDNSAKFMGEQSAPLIQVGMETRDNSLTIFVKDNGKGIAPHQLDSLFKAYVRLDPRITGTGLGLALVKQIIERQGGTIWAESAGLEHGTTLYIKLPHLSLIDPEKSSAP